MGKKMSRKRKLGEQVSATSYDLQADHIGRKDAAVNAAQSDPAGYPRRRVAIACEVCRVRKTRCDAGKPSCGLCRELEIECVYTRPNDRKHTADLGSATFNGQIETRLDRIEQCLRHIAEHREQIGGSYSCCSPRAATLNEPSLGLSEVAASSPAGAAPRSAAGSKIVLGARMPSLLSFNGPAPLQYLSYDHRKSFYDCELHAGEQLGQAIDTFQNGSVDLSLRTTWALQQAFADSFLRYYPIFDAGTIISHVERASSAQYEGQDSSTCLVFLIYAIGAISRECGSVYTQDVAGLPGFRYFVRAFRLLAKSPWSCRDLAVVQSRILIGSYLLIALRPLQAWNALSQASRDHVVLLMHSGESMDQDMKDQMQRAYWVSYCLENELEVCLELPTSGMRGFRDRVDLPSGRQDEEGLYFLLAMSSHRRVTMDVLDTVGWTSGSVIHAPLVALELRKQLQDWYHHLPPPLKFPLDASIAFDPAKTYLRTQYTALIAVINWPFVLCTMMNENVQGRSIGADGVSVGPAECLEACVLHLRIACPILMQRTVLAHTLIRCVCSLAMILLLSFQCPALETLRPPDAAETLRQALIALNAWDMVPFLQTPLARLSSIRYDA